MTHRKYRKLILKKVKLLAEIEAIEKLIKRLKRFPDHYCTTIIDNEVRIAEIEHLISESE